MLNKVELIGRIAFEPELRSTESNTPVMSVRLACTRDRKGENGERQTDWIDVVLWRYNAEYVKRFGSKGRLLCVVGRLQSRDWADKNGVKHTAVEVEAESVYLIDNKKTELGNLQSKFEELNEEEDGLPF